MVSGVELVFVDYVENMWEFESCYVVGFQQVCEVVDEVVDVGYMGEDVVGCYYVGLFVFCGKFFGQCLFEEFFNDFDVFCVCCCCCIFCWFDVEIGDVVCFYILQEIVVVCCDFDYM